MLTLFEMHSLIFWDLFWGHVTRKHLDLKETDQIGVNMKVFDSVLKYNNFYST